jgi:3-phenylpropionate/cinnamic acid dioxygenase small subunit
VTVGASVEDRLAIQDLFVRYAFALDEGDVEGIVACFAPGAALESPVLGVQAGDAAIRGFAERFSAFQRKGNQLRHVMTNFAIDVDGDAARARCYLVNILTRDGKTIVGPPGRYDCKLARHGGAWLFQHRLVVLDAPFPLEGL